MDVRTSSITVSLSQLMIPTSSNTYFEKFRSYNCLVAAPFRSQKTLPSSRTPPISGAAAERSQQPRWLQADRKTLPCSHLREAPAWAMSWWATSWLPVLRSQGRPAAPRAMASLGRRRPAKWRCRDIALAPSPTVLLSAAS